MKRFNRKKSAKQKQGSGSGIRTLLMTLPELHARAARELDIADAKSVAEKILFCGESMRKFPDDLGIPADMPEPYELVQQLEFLRTIRLILEQQAKNVSSIIEFIGGPGLEEKP